MKYFALVTFFLASACASSVEAPSPEGYFARLSIDKVDVGSRSQEYYPLVDLEGFVAFEDAREPVTLSGNDLATMHLLYAYAWRDAATGPESDADVASCLDSGMIYVPATEESFRSYCGGDGHNRVGCYYSGESLMIEGLVRYVQIVRPDHYKYWTNNSDLLWVYAHEMGHAVAECLYGDSDRDHELFPDVWDVSEVAAEYFVEWFSDTGRL